MDLGLPVPLWIYSPLCNVYYRSKPATKTGVLTPIITTDDVDTVVIETMRDRIRFQKLGNSNFSIVPVIFYNENDRLKSMKESPFLTIKPEVPLQVKDYILTDTQKLLLPEAQNPDDQVLYNVASTWYEFGYTITLGCDEWPLYRRLQTFLKDVLFGLQYGQRRIQTNDQDGDTHYRELVIENETPSEDFERNYFQYDLSINFRIPLNVQEWTPVPRIHDFEITVQNNNALSIDGEQVISDSLIDKTIPPGIIDIKPTA